MNKKRSESLHSIKISLLGSLQKTLYFYFHILLSKKHATLDDNT